MKQLLSLVLFSIPLLANFTSFGSYKNNYGEVVIRKATSNEIQTFYAHITIDFFKSGYQQSVHLNDKEIKNGVYTYQDNQGYGLWKIYQIKFTKNKLQIIPLNRQLANREFDYAIGVEMEGTYDKTH